MYRLRVWLSSGLLWAQGQVTLPAPVSLFAVDALHHMYVWSEPERALYKVWAPRYDSLTRIGGAPGEEGFLSVTSIAPIGNQQLYVLDAGGQKITLLGTNLQPLQQLLYSQLPPEVAQGYPVLLTVGSGGELYLFLRETQEVVKIDFFGRVLLRFGGKLFGPGRIVGGAALYAEAEQLFITDTVQRQILVYDSWGNFLKGVAFPEGMDRGAGFAAGTVFYRDTVGWWYSREGQELPLRFPTAPQAVWVREQRLYWAAGRVVGWLPLP